MLTQEHRDFFLENGFLRVEQTYSPGELREMSDELDYVMQNFANWDAAWRCPWRKEYLDEEADKKATLVALHELQHYSAAWMHAVSKPELADAVAMLMDTDAVELHHVTLHAK